MIGYEHNVANNPLTMNIVATSFILTKDCKEISYILKGISLWCTNELGLE